MQKLKIRTAVLLVCALGCIRLFTGCSRWAGGADAREDPLFSRAKSKIREGDNDGAIEWLNKALERNPRLAAAHLELALLYDDARKDYVRAIYHYERYLELYPETEKKARIEEYISRAKTALASAMPSVDERVRTLQRENADLKRELLELRREMAAQYALAREQSAAPKSAAPTPAAQAAPAEPKKEAPTGGTCQIKKGDTLSTIAARVYGDPAKWRKIQEANKDVLGGSHLLKVGQTITIPPP